LVITSGRPIYGLPKQFGFIAGGYILGIPFPVIIMIFIYIIGYLYLTRVRTGMYCYAVGGNQEAARLAGVDIKKIKISAYVVSGISASIGGTILSSRLISIEPLAGLGYELDAIAAAVIGGANLMGGEGNLIGTLIGAITMGILRNGLNLLNVSAYWQQVAVGLVIAAVVSVNALRKE
jgi:ribose transport system permease protein